MTQRIIILFGLILLLNSCNESNQVQPVLYETFIELGRDINEIIIEEDCLNIRCYNTYLKFSTTGDLIEVREIKNTNSVYSIAFKFIKGGFIKVEQIADTNFYKPAKFLIHQYSFENKNVKTDTLQTQNSSPWIQFDIILANNYDLQNDNKIRFYIDYFDMYLTKRLIDFFSKTPDGNFQHIISYALDYKLALLFHSSYLFYAYRDVFLFFGKNLKSAGDGYTKDFYIFYPDGSFNLAHSKENEDEDTEVFEYSNKLYANYKSKNKSRLLSSSDLKSWSSNNLDFTFKYLGTVNSILLGKVNNVVGKLDLADNKFYKINSEFDFSDCIKIIEYKGFTYFVKERQIIKIESSKITFANTEYKYS